MEESGQGVLKSLGVLLERRRNVKLLMLAYSDEGMEMLGNTMDFVIEYGMLTVARATVEENHRIAIMRASQCHQEEESMVSMPGMKFN